MRRNNEWTNGYVINTLHMLTHDENGRENGLLEIALILQSRI